MPYIYSAYRGARIPPSRMAIVAAPQASEPVQFSAATRGRRVTDNEREQIVAALADLTVSYEAISLRFGRATYTIRSIAIANGYRANRRGPGAVRVRA